MEPKADLDPTWIWGRIRNTVGIELFRSNVTTFCCSSTGHCFIVPQQIVGVFVLVLQWCWKEEIT